MQQLRRLTIRVLLAGVLCAGARDAFAQSYTGAPVMQDPISIRASSMGLTGAADNSDPGNIWFNPANAVGRNGVYLDHGRWETNALYDDYRVPFTRWAAGGTFGAGSGIDIGVNATFGQLDYGEYTATDVMGNTIGVYDVWERYASVTTGVATRVGRRVDLRFGTAAKRFWADYGVQSFVASPQEVKPEGFAFDLGIAAAMPMAYEEWTVTPAVGFAYVNFGGEIEITLDEETNRDPFPARLHYGSSVRVDGPATSLWSAQVPLVSFVFNADATDRLHGDYWSWGMGGELSVMQILFLRSGVLDEQREEGFYLGSYDRPAWSIGLGVPAGPARVRFDYGRVYDYDEPRYEFFAGWEF